MTSTVLASSGSSAARILVALYLGGIVSANALAAKLFEVAGVHVTAGALAIPLVYLTTDMLNELYGPRFTKQVVWMGFGANMVLLSMSLLAKVMPVSPFGATQADFDAMFSITWRVAIGSSVAYLVSSLLDVWLFAWIRKRTGERAFWLRKNGSTFISQFVDTGLFVLMAFSFTMPWQPLLVMWLGQYLVKVSAAPLGTPLSYAVLRLARRT